MFPFSVMDCSLVVLRMVTNISSAVMRSFHILTFQTFDCSVLMATLTRCEVPNVNVLSKQLEQTEFPFTKV